MSVSPKLKNSFFVVLLQEPEKYLGKIKNRSFYLVEDVIYVSTTILATGEDKNSFTFYSPVLDRKHKHNLLVSSALETFANIHSIEGLKELDETLSALDLYYRRDLRGLTFDVSKVGFVSLGFFSNDGKAYYCLTGKIPYDVWRKVSSFFVFYTGEDEKLPTHKKNVWITCDPNKVQETLVFHGVFGLYN